MNAIPKELKKLKVCLVTDWLTNLGGGEKVVKAIADLFPEAPIYTTVADFKAVETYFPDPSRIKTSYLQRIPKASKKHQWLLPLLSGAIRSFDFSEYDIVLSFSSCVAKNIKTNPLNQKHICYIHTPARYAWEMDYDPRFARLPIGVKQVARLYLKHFKNLDHKFRHNPQTYIANSSETASRVKIFYDLPSKTLYPPVDFNDFSIADKKQDFYLGLGRMVPYKKFDLLVETFLQIPEQKLILAGDGPERKLLEAKVEKAGAKNITFLGKVSDGKRRELFATAKAVLLPQREDAGIVQLEAFASGTPVIAYEAGGVLDVLKPGINGVFFKEQNPSSLITGIQDFERKSTAFNPLRVRKTAEAYSVENFQKNYLSLIHKSL